jgi:formylglycine-generating enzyme required for sulfatase activity
MILNLKSQIPNPNESTKPQAPSIKRLEFVIGCLMLLSLTACNRPPEGMVLVPAGSFVMGTDEVELEEMAKEFGIAKPWVMDATPAHEVNLPAFFIHRYEVSNAEYFRFVEATGYPRLPHWSDGRPSPEQAHLPVVFVDWEEAEGYCRWIGGRLPTEEEWEKAARGADGRIYPWGNEFDRQRANVGGVFPGPLKVGSLPSGDSPYGLSDMIGNVWEWTDSWYKPYARSEYLAPEYEEQYRVIRGNSFSELGHFPPDLLDRIIAAQARVTYRLFLPSNAAIEDVGFRCAKSATGEQRVGSDGGAG